MSTLSVVVTLTYSEREAREVARAIRYFDSNVSATDEDHDRLSLIATAIQLRLPPPKPAEPTGLGAVVEVHGRRWVYTGDRGQGGQWWYSAAEPARWSDFDSVTVLSGGVAL